MSHLLDKLIYVTSEPRAESSGFGLKFSCHEGVWTPCSAHCATAAPWFGSEGRNLGSTWLRLDKYSLHWPCPVLRLLRSLLIRHLESFLTFFSLVPSQLLKHEWINTACVVTLWPMGLHAFSRKPAFVSCRLRPRRYGNDFFFPSECGCKDISCFILAATW